MKSFIAMLIALAVRESQSENEDMRQIANGVIAATIVSELTRA